MFVLLLFVLFVCFVVVCFVVCFVVVCLFCCCLFCCCLFCCCLLKKKKIFFVSFQKRLKKKKIEKTKINLFSPKHLIGFYIFGFNLTSININKNILFIISIHI